VNIEVVTKCPIVGVVVVIAGGGDETVKVRAVDEAVSLVESGVIVII
jgi:hypothetical protein